MMTPSTNHERDEYMDEVYGIITRNELGEVLEVEFLSSPPKWDLEAENQICFVGNINGGDSIRYSPERN